MVETQALDGKHRRGFGRPFHFCALRRHTVNAKIASSLDNAPMLIARFLAMLRRVEISDDDLALAAAGCRALAYRYREDAKRQKNPLIVEASLRRAEESERLAEHFDRERAALD